MNPARLSTHRGPHGDILVTKTYTNFEYSVTMRTDGAIEVKHGDWLSKYSSAMYNDFKHIHEFARVDKKGNLKKIHAVNHIFAGETIYHLPTYNELHPMRMDAIDITASPLSDEQEEKIIRDTLKDDYGLQGERLEWLVEIAHRYHEAETIGVEIPHMIAESAEWITEETAIGATIGSVVTGIGLVGAALTCVMIGIEILNANDTDKKLAGMQAICYAVPAWAFGDPIPGFPSSLRRNFMSGIGPGKYGLDRVIPAWNDACDNVVRNMEKKVRDRGRSKESYQNFWQAIGQFDRKTLIRRLMDSRAEEINHDVERMSFMALDPDGYPN